MKLKELINYLKLIDEKYPDNDFEFMVDNFDYDRPHCYKFVAHNPNVGTYNKKEKRFNLITDCAGNENTIDVVCLRCH
jgi:hypothetical protein